jgi:metal-responsive CopG/Arc/MetJ family transcriptional regulator
MNRKTIKTRTGAYHVTLPIRLVEEFDELLSFKASRSKAIAYLMRKHLDNDETDVGMMETKNVLAALMTRFKSGTYEWNTLKVMYDTISRKHDEQSS